ncbi:MAG TPA: hypothetical protein VE978_22910 [Chitinophagales bacterium]|nr:hypothetical protein [Chitinophagales bacterium]
MKKKLLGEFSIETEEGEQYSIWCGAISRIKLTIQYDWKSIPAKKDNENQFQ